MLSWSFRLARNVASFAGTHIVKCQPSLLFERSVFHWGRGRPAGPTSVISRTPPADWETRFAQIEEQAKTGSAERKRLEEQQAKPSQRTASRTYVEHARDRQLGALYLEALAGVVGMSVGELVAELQPMALLRNDDTHPGDLEALRRMVAAAKQACGEKPQDQHLAFARRFLACYPLIEKKLLRQ